MLGTSREVWGDLPTKLQDKGFSVLALDLRGHGRSTQKGSETTNYQDFSDSDWKSLPLDLVAAKKFLRNQLGLETRVYLVGASIGANASLILASQDPEIKGIVLLSPGEIYHNLATYEAATSYQDRPALVVSSQEDTQSFEPSQKIASLIGDRAVFMGESNAGHGNKMLTTDPTLVSRIIDFLQAN